MRQVDHIPPSVPHFEAPKEQSLIKTVRGVGRAAYTLFNVPLHDSSLFNDLAVILADEPPQPTHAPIEDEVETIATRSARLVDADIRPTISGKELLGHMGVLMQFTSYLPDVRPFAQTPFQHIDDLYSQIVEEGKGAPLGFADQLDLALEQTAGDLPEAVWRLFITSRQHARWFDSSVITGMPELTREEKMNRMYDFSHAVAACRSHEVSPIQDTGGDTYYGWTHALGRLAFGALAEKQTGLTKIGGKAMHNGTRLMHELAHRFKPQTLPSDHTVAAAYGNAVGDALVQIMQPEALNRS